jgi:hypothetical protein
MTYEAEKPIGLTRINMPGFTADAAVYIASMHYRCTLHCSNSQQVIAQTKLSRAFKAGRLVGRCLQLGYSNIDCYTAGATSTISATNTTYGRFWYSCCRTAFKC